jgi:hypothetical protein
MNDAALARELVEELLAENHNDAAAVGYACGVIAGWHVGRSGEHRKTMSRQWGRFVKLKPLWK